ncbi:hypothetical protein ACVW0J_008622 [Bradyrhizobium sp. i1.7.7]
MTPPITALRDPVSRSSFCSSPGCAEMHLGVHHARQDVEALAVDHLSGGGLRERAQLRDAAVGDADIANTLAVLVDDGAAFEDHIEALGHG